jgi:enoyl-CoA hydratase
MTLSTITVDVRGAVAVLTLNRPDKANTLNGTLLNEIEAACGDIAHSPEIRVLVVTGAGRHFCGGADLQWVMESGGRSPGRHLAIDIPQPVIAAINGPAFGGGFELALACDFRFVAATATLALPEILFGALPMGGGIPRLTKLVGPARAKRLIMTGEEITAQLAGELGIADQVCEPDEFMAEVMNFAELLTSRPSFAVNAAKLLVDQATEVPLASALAFERQVISTMAGDDERTAAREAAKSESATYARIFRTSGE